jgi:hypothetical protein
LYFTAVANDLLPELRGEHKLLRDARPEWVMLGLEWPGPGVLLMASRSLTAAQLDFRARAYQFDSIAQLMANFRPELTLDVHMRDDYVLVAGPDYVRCLSALLEQWSPDGEVVAT